MFLHIFKALSNMFVEKRITGWLLVIFSDIIKSGEQQRESFNTVYIHRNSSIDGYKKGWEMAEGIQWHTLPQKPHKCCHLTPTTTPHKTTKRPEFRISTHLFRPVTDQRQKQKQFLSFSLILPLFHQEPVGHLCISVFLSAAVLDGPLCQYWWTHLPALFLCPILCIYTRCTKEIQLKTLIKKHALIHCSSLVVTGLQYTCWCLFFWQLPFFVECMAQGDNRFYRQRANNFCLLCRYVYINSLLLSCESQIVQTLFQSQFQLYRTR